MANSAVTAVRLTVQGPEVRRVLGLEAGDRVEFQVEGSMVRLRKAERELSDDLVFRLVQTHAMRDWDTPEDDEAFRRGRVARSRAR